MSVEIVVTGRGVNSKRKLNGYKRRTSIPTPAWRKVGALISREVRLQFATRGGNFGTPWKPLTPEYAARKKAMGFPRQILVMSGKMRNSFTQRPMDIERYQGQRAVFGSNERKVAWHQYGTRRNGKRVNPPRPMLKLTPVLRRKIVKAVESYIVSGRS